MWGGMPSNFGKRNSIRRNPVFNQKESITDAITEDLISANILKVVMRNEIKNMAIYYHHI